MHYYFHTREEIYDRLVAETYSIVVDCIARANREDTLLDQLSAFVTAAYRSGLVDGSMIRFTVMARPSGPVVDAVRGFYASIVDDAIARGEIPADTDASAVVSMVLAMFLGMAFYAGFIGDQNDLTMIARQLYRPTDGSRLAGSAAERPRAHHDSGRAGHRVAEGNISF